MFAREYIEHVLSKNFADAQRLLLGPLMAIHYAHLVMLTEQRVISREDAARIRGALDAIDLDAVARASYDGTCEDLFFFVERLITANSSEEAAGHLHTARSRNDIDM